MFDGLYHPFMVILGMDYDFFQPQGIWTSNKIGAAMGSFEEFIRSPPQVQAILTIDKHIPHKKKNMLRT